MKRIFALALGAALAGCAAAAVAAARLDGATIVNSGSTNAAGYTIEVWSNGKVMLAGSHDSKLDAALAARFLADLRAARSANALGRPCMKSVSFGTRTTVRYHGWTSPDLSCPGGDALLEPLRSDVAAIAARVGAATQPRRRVIHLGATPPP